MRRTLMSIAVATALGGLSVSMQAAPSDYRNANPHDPNVEDLAIPDVPPMLGIHWSREMHGAAQHQARRSANMTYHGGKIMPTAVTKAIFWGPSWSNATSVGDKITGLDSWYTGHSNSNYAKTVNEYTGTNGQVAAATTHQGHVIDTSTATGGSSTSAILAEVCKQVSAGHIVPDPGGNGYYPVYSDVNRGNAGYCAYHSAGTCGGKPVQFAFFSIWTVMRVAIRRTRPRVIRKAWQHWPT